MTLCYRESADQMYFIIRIIFFSYRIKMLVVDAVQYFQQSQCSFFSIHVLLALLVFETDK